jgi:hypothetical protein
VNEEALAHWRAVAQREKKKDAVRRETKWVDSTVNMPAI